MERRVPKQMTTPIGCQSKSPPVTIGSTPKAVVHDVRNIGLIRRCPAIIAASLTLYPCLNLSSSAYSYIRIPFRTIMPIRLIIPRIAVNPRSRSNIHRPMKAPKRQRVLIARVNSARDSFLKWNTMNITNIITAATTDRMISGMTCSFVPDSPLYSTTVPFGNDGTISFSIYSLIFFDATGWLLPNFMSANMLIDSSFPYLSSVDGCQSGSILATCLKGTLTPGIEVGIWIFSIS